MQKKKKQQQQQQRGWAAVPEIAGRYELGATLGEGTFGKVKKGVHLLSGVEVAVKVLEKARITDMADMERVEREIYILKSVAHQNVIRLLEVVDSADFIFLVMEFAEGGELFEAIVRETRLDDLTACRVFHDLLNGIDYCHNRGIVHRDLKPENLLLDADGRVKVADFGLGNVADGPDRMMETACGSPCYAAPEMIAGHLYHGPTADLWSAGVILFALVCGWLPFEDPSTSCLYDKILGAQYKVPSFVSAPCRDLIRRLLTTDPRRRITAEQIRSHPWYTQVEADSDPADPGGDLPSGDRETVYVQQDIVEHMGKLGYDTDGVLESLRFNKHDEMAATYAFLEEYKRRKRAELTAAKAEREAAAEGVVSDRVLEAAKQLLEEEEDDEEEEEEEEEEEGDDDGDEMEGEAGAIEAPTTPPHKPKAAVEGAVPPRASPASTYGLANDWVKRVLRGRRRATVPAAPAAPAPPASARRPAPRVPTAVAPVAVRRRSTSRSGAQTHRARASGTRRSTVPAGGVSAGRPRPRPPASAVPVWVAAGRARARSSTRRRRSASRTPRTTPRTPRTPRAPAARTPRPPARSSRAEGAPPIPPAFAFKAGFVGGRRRSSNAAVGKAPRPPPAASRAGRHSRGRTGSFAEALTVSGVK